jgi:uncharacterized protein
MSSLSPPAPSPAALGPVQPGERIAVIDIVRGLSLFGVLLINILIGFGGPATFMQGAGQHPWATPSDQAAAWLAYFLIQGKFISIFAFLFGLGLALQMRRIEARGGQGAAIHRRRLVILLLVGVAHAILLWWGDILVPYALLGLVLLLFRASSPRVLLGIAAGLAALTAFLAATAAGLLGLAEAATLTTSTAASPVVAYLTQVYADGSYAAIIGANATIWLQQQLPGLVLYGPGLLMLLVLGLAAGRLGLFTDTAAHRTPWTRLAWLGLGLGLPLNAVGGWYATFGDPFRPWDYFVTLIHSTLGAPLLSAGYVAGLALLTARPGWTGRLAPLGAVGRLAFTTYLLQSVICVLIFYGPGLGLYGRVGAVQIWLLSLLIYGLQVVASALWLRAFRHGPAEAAWRALTYGAWPAMRAAPRDAP